MRSHRAPVRGCAGRARAWAARVPECADVQVRVWRGARVLRASRARVCKHARACERARVRSDAARVRECSGAGVHGCSCAHVRARVRGARTVRARACACECVSTRAPRARTAHGRTGARTPGRTPTGIRVPAPQHAHSRMRARAPQSRAAALRYAPAPAPARTHPLLRGLRTGAPVRLCPRPYPHPRPVRPAHPCGLRTLASAHPCVRAPVHPRIRVPASCALCATLLLQQAKGGGFICAAASFGDACSSHLAMHVFFLLAVFLPLMSFCSLSRASWVPWLGAASSTS